MDLLFFLDSRTKFIRQFYLEASSPFNERKRKIEAGESPFDPRHIEEGEPPFLTEWLEADESLEVLGQMCISFLAATLHWYIEGSISEINTTYGRDVGRDREKYRTAFKQGRMNGYRAVFREELNIEWEKGPSDLGLLEQIILARNSSQHPLTIATLSVYQSEEDARKYPRAFFGDEAELALFGGAEESEGLMMPCRLEITKDKLFNAIDEVDAFAAWLEEQLWPQRAEELREVEDAVP